MAIPNVVGAVGLVSGIPGEIAFDGPQRAVPAILDSPVEANNLFGRVFTYLAEVVGEDAERVRAGGEGFFAGIHIVPKAYAIDALYARNNTQGEFLCEGEVYVQLVSAAGGLSKGSPIWYQIADGQIGAGPLPAEGAVAIPGAYVSRHRVSAETPLLAVVYVPGLANLPENEVEVGGGG